MRNMGVIEAAAAIRGQFSSDRSFRGSPEEAHQMAFAKGVAKELGAGETPEEVLHVMGLLREAGIALHAGHEYPKYATRKWDRTAKIVHSEGEEQAWVDEAQPEPVNPDDLPPARTLDAPVQDLSIDLRDKVPHMVGDAPPQPTTPRVPSAVTNREAAQDAYARQPSGSGTRDAASVAYDKANPGLDHGQVYENEGTVDDAFHDDGEVHVEEVGEDTLASNADRNKGGATFAKPADTGVMAHDDPDRDGVAGQDVNPTHDSMLGTQHPQPRSGDSSAGKTDTGRRPVGTKPNPKRP